jgi:hypothetical protein
MHSRFCKELGYAEHQRVSVVHHEPTTCIIHVAIKRGLVQILLSVCFCLARRLYRF